MPKINKALNNLERIVLSNYVDTAVYFWVSGMRSVMPSITIEKAIELFIRKNNIENFDESNLRNRYLEMQKKIYENGTPKNI